MPQTISISSKGRAYDKFMLSSYAFFWSSHLVLGLITGFGPWFAGEDERLLILAWCAFIVVVIPLALLLMRRTQSITATERAFIIVGTGILFPRTVEVPRSQTIKLNLESCCWDAYQLLILRWGRWPWQSVFLAPLTNTNEKKSIAASVVVFLEENHFKFTTIFTKQ